MTHANSSFKLRSLLWSSCRRQIAFFTLSFLALFCTLPLYQILNIQAELRYWDNSNPEMRNNVADTIRQQLYGAPSAILMLIVLGVIAGIAMFHYLHVRKQTDFFHALPISRGQMFAVQTITGLLGVIPAYVINFALSCVVVQSFGYGDVLKGTHILLTLCMNITGFLLVYAFAILAAILCGTTLVAVLGCAWLEGGVLVGWTIGYQLLTIFYPAWNSEIIPVSRWSSPAVAACTLSEPMRYGFVNGVLANYTASEIVIPIVGCFVVAIAAFALSYALNRIRKSENTGLAMAFPVIELPLKIFMTAVLAGGVGLIFQTMTNSWPVMFLGMAFGVVVSTCVIEIIYNLDFRSLFHRWKSTLVFAAVCAVVLACMANDVTHYNTTLPTREDIVSANLYSSVETWNTQSKMEGNSWAWNASGGDTAAFHQQMTSAEAIDVIYNSAQIGAELMQGDRSTIKEGELYSNGNYVVTFTLENGKTFERSYYAPYENEQLGENGAIVRNTQEYLENRSAEAFAYHQTEQFGAMYFINYIDANNSTLSNQIEDTAAIQQILYTLYQESLKLDKAYLSAHPPIAVLRVLTKDSMEKMPESKKYDYYYAQEMLSESGYVELPVYECEIATLNLLAQYVPDFKTDFGGHSINKLTVNVYNYNDVEEGMGTDEVILYDEIQINELSKKLVANDFTTVMDPVYMSSVIYNTGYTDSYYDVMAELDDGRSINCMLPNDGTNMFGSPVTIQPRMIDGGADISVTAESSAEVNHVVG